MMPGRIDSDWLRAFATHLEKIDPGGFLPLVSADVDHAHALLWQYRRQDFILTFGTGQLLLPAITDLGGAGTTENDCLDPGSIEVSSLEDALALIRGVESIRQRTDYPHIRLGRLTTGPAVFNPPLCIGLGADTAPAVDVGAFLGKI